MRKEKRTFKTLGHKSKRIFYEAIGAVLFIVVVCISFLADTSIITLPYWLSHQFGDAEELLLTLFSVQASISTLGIASLEIVSCYLKNEVENYRLEMKANFFEACLKEVEKRTEILPVDVLKSKRSILWQAYEITHKQEYLDYLDAVLAEIYDLENGSNSAISNIATHSVIHKGLYSKAYELYSQIADNAIRDDYGDMLYSWACLNCKLKNFRTFLDFCDKQYEENLNIEYTIQHWAEMPGYPESRQFMEALHYSELL